MPTEPLTHILRSELAGIHADLERVSQIPARIKDLAAYIGCLRLYHAIYQPLETGLGANPAWASVGIDFDQRRRLPALSADLEALEAAIPQSNIPIPAFDGFGEALGAFYVSEGSVLGGRFILSSIRPVLGQEIEKAQRFFVGRGDNTSSLWLSFKAIVDHFGRTHPRESARVLDGAAKCFGIFAAAFSAHWELPDIE